jgi:hypothetical protein
MARRAASGSTKRRPAARRAKGARRAGGARSVGLLLTLGSTAILVMSPASFVLLLVGFLPTVVACVIDREPGLPLAVSVGAMNSVGVLFFAVDLWMGPQSLGAAFALITDVFTLLVMYAAAAMGWIIYLGMPPVAATYLSVSQELRAQKLARHQESLIKEWGDSVSAGGRL